MTVMASNDPDVALMLRVREGDTEALRELIERHQRAVINTIHRSIGDAWEAEDLAQRVFVQVYRSANRYKPTAKFTTWLFTITHNTILNERRRRSRHPAESLDALQDPADPESAGWQPPDPAGRDPAQEAVERELREKIQQAIQELPEAQRTAVILCRYEGQSYEEIAAVLGCSVSATKSLLHRARLTLKDKLRGYY
ncbi:MAG TPA: sigma-70 family RNA polymerase sigma factor [Verrucomicrobiae bacterium]|nr:sigma-70 family RNA polymerase sigma factor [Verrucomicrobiae bacterium]